jgi:hypothetical protein
MRPASEIHSALSLLNSEIERQGDETAKTNMLIARDVLAWVSGERPPWDGPTCWLLGFLLGDPPTIDNTPPEAN